MAEQLRTDIAAARDKMAATLGAGREIKRLESHLWEGEQVEAMVSGWYGKGNGLLTLTDQRLLFTVDGMINSTTEDFPLDKVSSVQWSSGMAMGTITIFASGNKAAIEKVFKKDGKAFVDQVRGRLQQRQHAPAAPAAPAAAPAGDPMTALEQLGKLRDAGVVTDEEFAAKKAELLARM